MTIKNIVAILLGVYVLTACSSKGLEEWVPLEDTDEAHISLNLIGYNLEKHEAEVFRKRNGWAETAEWRNADGSEVRVRVFANVNYANYVFMASDVKPLEEVVRSVTGDGYVELGASGRFYTQYGFYEYQIYSTSGLLCMLVQSYWTDHSFAGIDVVRGAEASDAIVGNHHFQAYFCDADKQSIDIDDLAEFLLSMDLRDAYWPDDRFDPVE